MPQITGSGANGEEKIHPLTFVSSTSTSFDGGLCCVARHYVMLVGLVTGTGGRGLWFHNGAEVGLMACEAWCGLVCIGRLAPVVPSEV
jgi:hypothetical protein